MISNGKQREASPQCTKIVHFGVARRRVGLPDFCATVGRRQGYNQDMADFDIYVEHILDHYKNPRNRGTLENPDLTARDGNPLCGDEIRMDFKVKDGRIVDVKFSGHGCTISQASASILTEMIKGKPLDYVKQLKKDDLLEALGIPIGPTRLKCALLSLKVAKAAVYGLDKVRDEDLE